MYIVRRPFRNCGEMMLPGSIVEPGSIKWFKTRLRDKVVVEVTEQTLDNWDAYFKSKFGVSIKPVAAPEPVKPVAAPEPVKPAKVEPTKPVQAAKPAQVAKAVVKA